MTKVNEGESITFKCKADDKTKGTIHMYLFKNCERVKLDVFEAPKDHTAFFFTKITVEHSGLYTCLYSKDKLNMSKTTATGYNSISLEVLGRTHSCICHYIHLRLYSRHL